jgi:hypothetical protein
LLSARSAGAVGPAAAPRAVLGRTGAGVRTAGLAAPLPLTGLPDLAGSLALSWLFTLTRLAAFTRLLARLLTRLITRLISGLLARLLASGLTGLTTGRLTGLGGILARGFPLFTGGTLLGISGLIFSGSLIAGAVARRV